MHVKRSEFELETVLRSGAGYFKRGASAFVSHD
jgi:hypothetical protein